MVIARTSNVLRRITTLLIISCLLTVALCVNTAVALPGSGTQEDPYRIESLADFDEFAAGPNYWDDYTRLETDVNLAGRTYTTAVIAPDVNNSNYDFDGTAFTGVFDGNDHKIIGLTIDDGGAGNDCLGLFGYIEGGFSEVKNLALEGGFVRGTGDYVGGLVGANGDYYHPGGAISNCYSTGSVNGTDYYVGGLVGLNACTVSNCYSTGDVNGTGWGVGGLVGVNWEYGRISNCYSTGNVSGYQEVGGLVGINADTVSNCYSTGDVNGVGGVGGLVGENGDVGAVPPFPGHIINSYSNGDVNGDYSVGGLVGINADTVSNCYSIGDVNGSKDVGGLVGVNGAGGRPFYHGQIINSYSTGDVNGVDDVGGLVGYNFVGGIEGSFWDLETSGEPNMCGLQNNHYATGCDPNCGKTTAEMQTKTTFTDPAWDFVDIWLINEGATYPVLRQEIRSDLNADDKVNMLDFAVFADHWLEGTGD
jgi:hypothetical protein